MKDSKLSKEQQARVHDLIDESCETLALCDEIGTCPEVGVHSKLLDEVLFFVHKSAIKRNKSWLLEQK